jgi:hypothetical protein
MLNVDAVYADPSVILSLKVSTWTKFDLFYTKRCRVKLIFVQSVHYGNRNI